MNEPAITLNPTILHLVRYMRYAKNDVIKMKDAMPGQKTVSLEGRKRKLGRCLPNTYMSSDPPLTSPRIPSVNGGCK